MCASVSEVKPGFNTTNQKYCDSSFIYLMSVWCDWYDVYGGDHGGVLHKFNPQSPILKWHILKTTTIGFSFHVHLSWYTLKKVAVADDTPMQQQQQQQQRIIDAKVLICVRCHRVCELLNQEGKGQNGLPI